MHCYSFIRAVDVSSQADVTNAVKTFAEQNGSSIHHLVNGGQPLRNLLLNRSHLFYIAACFVSRGLDATLDDFNKSHQTNVCGYAFMVQAVYPYMKNAGGKLLKRLLREKHHSTITVRIFYLTLTIWRCNFQASRYCYSGFFFLCRETVFDRQHRFGLGPPFWRKQMDVQLQQRSCFDSDQMHGKRCGTPIILYHGLQINIFRR